MTELEELRTELAAACALLDAARKQRNESREKCAGLQREVALLSAALKISAIEWQRCEMECADTPTLIENWKAKAIKHYPGLQEAKS